MNKYKRLEYCEKLLAVALRNSDEKYCLGKIIDYEIPLKEKMSDKLGKIDIISVDSNGQSVRLIELKIKNKNGDETLLRALLEIYTYYKLIDCSGSKIKLLEDYELPTNYKLIPVVLTDERSLSGEMLSHMDKYPRLNNLISKMNEELGVKIEGYVYDYPKRCDVFLGDAKAGDPNKWVVRLNGDIKIRKIL